MRTSADIACMMLDAWRLGTYRPAGLSREVKRSWFRRRGLTLSLLPGLDFRVKHIVRRTMEPIRDASRNRPLQFWGRPRGDEDED
jgi:hypothetical protein